MKRLGINMNLAPVLDVFTDRGNTVIGSRSYSSDPGKVALLGEEYVRTLQSNGILATLKHFPGHGPTSVDSHKDLPVVRLTAEEIDSVHIMPFAQVIANAEPAAVMTAHILYPNLDSKPATMSNVIISDILRSRLGFTGLVMTDSLEMDAMRRNYSAREIVSSSVNAGVDILLVSNDVSLAREVRATIIGLVRRGEIPESRLNSAVENILRTKSRFKIIGQ
jgi:beta-N-acetylhexosaminidase